MRALQVFLGLVLAWGVIAFGGVYPWGYWSVAAGAAVTGLWAGMLTRAWQRPSVRTAAACLGAVAVTMSLQAVPLPRALFLRLSPAADAALAGTDIRYLMNPPDTHALALMPDNTLVVLAVFAAFALMFMGLLVAVPRMRIERTAGMLIALGVVLSLVGVAVRTANIKDPVTEWYLVYGFWHTIAAGNPFGPFVNRNHFAGWLVMVLPLAVATGCLAMERSGLSPRDPWHRWLHWTTTPQASRFMTTGAACLIMGVTLVVTGSRSGIASFAVAMTTLGYFVARRMGRRRSRHIAIGVLGLLVVAIIAGAGTSGVIHRFSLASTDAVERFTAWGYTLRVIRDFPWFGVGAGGFGRAMLTYQVGDHGIFYAESHNDYLQILAEGGLLVAIPIAVCFVALIRAIASRVRDGQDDGVTYWIRAAAIAGLVGIAAQSFVEFSLHMSGNFALFVFLAAVAAHRPLRMTQVHARRV